MNKVALVIVCLIVVAVISAAAPGAMMIWNFNPDGKHKRVGASTESIHGSATGLSPLDTSTPLVTVGGFNADNTVHDLRWKKRGKTTEEGIGLTGTRHHELTLKNKGTAIANYLRIDMTAPLALTTPITGLAIEMQSIDKKEEFDVWGSNDASSFGTKLISGSAGGDSFVSIPLDGSAYDKYYFVTVTPQGKGHRKDDVLLEAIRFDLGTTAAASADLTPTSDSDLGPTALDVVTPAPEPATLSLLALGGLAMLRRRTRR